MIQMINVACLNHNEKLLLHGAREHTEIILSEKALQKSHPDHMHLVHFKSMKTFNVRKTPGMVPEKKIALEWRKAFAQSWGHLAKVEVVLWIGLQCGKHNYPSFWSYVQGERPCFG